ncbi:MAG: peroxiredoxin-like family protein [Saprospiraceae bacterium]|nr:peroxiredoxin-like family protein [Saprospiraceae bacterium]
MLIIDQDILSMMKAQDNSDVLSLSNQQPTMLVFLRHFGCQFCREAMDDLSKLYPKLVKKNTGLILVHMSENDVAEEYFRKFNLSGVRHISDPDCRFYTAFGLVKGSFTQLFGLQSWIRGFTVQAKYGTEIGKHLGDSFQMPGAFVVFDGEIRDSYIHKIASDRPDYNKMLDSCSV